MDDEMKKEILKLISDGKELTPEEEWMLWLTEIQRISMANRTIVRSDTRFGRTI